jgi:hypothetical protein
MKAERIIDDGVYVQEKILKSEKCGTCKSLLFLQIYIYDKKRRKIIRCKKCNTYSVLHENKKYPTEI